MAALRYKLFWLVCLVSMAMTSAEVACGGDGVCDCSDDHTVDCRYKDLEEFPSEIPAETVTLHVEGNFITELRANDLAGLTDLEKLNLHFNSINDIEDESFGDLGNLEQLALDYNMVTVVTTSTFAGLDKLTHLSLIQNNISSIEDGSFQPLSSLRVLDLSFNKIPDPRYDLSFNKIPGEISLLDLSFNKIPGKISASTRSQLDLSFNKIPDKISLLDLSFNKIPGKISASTRSQVRSHCWIIEDGSFQPLSSLRVLDLSFNKIPGEISASTISQVRSHKIPGKVSLIDLSFNKIPGKISLLDLSFNKIPGKISPLDLSFNKIPGKISLLDLSFNKIPAAGVSAVLSGLEESLLELGLRYNMLQEVPAALGLLQNLQTLNLAGNNISSIRPIQNMTSLLTLDLSNNRVMHLDPSMFQNMERLEVLSLAYNRMGLIEEGVFWNLTELRSLDLQGNNVQRLHRGMFSNVATNSSRLRLHLRRMNLRTIDKFCFQDVGNPDAKIQIDLRNNRLKLLPPGLCRSLPEGQLSFKLAGNPWHCDCRMERVPELCPTAVTSRIRCAQPDALNRRLLGSLGADDLVCETTGEPEDGEADSVE
ncbi:hypothetical protein Bbelb_243490 [Branchiostoma belcheri]|nr:hypothetical protein Bbelb_243490 [Branchiostoma belcheri]